MVIFMKNSADWKNQLSRQDLRQVLSEKNACFVLITCGEPKEDGKMDVEMIYDGDASLAAFLIESAQGLIENDNDPT